MTRRRLISYGVLMMCGMGAWVQLTFFGAPPKATPDRAALPSDAVPVEASLPQKLIVRLDDGTTHEISVLPESRYLREPGLDLAPPAAPPKIFREGHFELLPNWEIGAEGAQLIPNYEKGMASMELIPYPTLAADFLAFARPTITAKAPATSERDD